MNHVMWPAVARTFRRAAPPLAWYYAITLALPLANGAAHASAAFAEHALIVLILPPVLLVLATVTREMRASSSPPTQGDSEMPVTSRAADAERLRT